MQDSLGDRMKGYEAVSQYKLCRRTPVIVRVDGRAFHTLTKNLDKPFDMRLVSAMVAAARVMVNEMQGAKLAYVQSDEASFLLTDWDKLTTEPWFGYEINKVVSLSAAIMSVHFNTCFATNIATFDARAFNVPREEISNYFLWRAKDWHRNSVQMYTRSFFSHKQCHNKSLEDMHEMLHSIGKNWSIDCSNQVKNGTFINKDGDCIYNVQPNFQEVSGLVQTCLPNESGASCE